MVKTPPGISGKTAERVAATGAVRLTGGGNGPAVAAQPVQLANDYRSATALSSNVITVITVQSQIDRSPQHDGPPGDGWEPPRVQPTAGPA